MLKGIKPEIRIVGWDDAPFKFTDKNTLLIGVVCRGGKSIDGVVTTKINVDGMDVTDKIIETIKNTKHRDQLRLMMFNGITFGGFNIIDMQKIHKETKLPLISIVRNNPDMGSIKKSLKRFKDFKKRWAVIERAGKVYPCEIKNTVARNNKKFKIYYQKAGIDKKTAENVIRMASTHSLIPEPIRVAHLIGSGLKGMKYD
jgi:endonuclease V-like protein UPF0215 family